MIRETAVLVERELKKWVGRRGTFFVSLVTPIAWLALFGKSLNFVNMFSVAGVQAVNPAIVKQYVDQCCSGCLGPPTTSLTLPLACLSFSPSSRQCSGAST